MAANLYVLAAIVVSLGSAILAAILAWHAVGAGTGPVPLLAVSGAFVLVLWVVWWLFDVLSPSWVR